MANVRIPQLSAGASAHNIVVGIVVGVVVVVIVVVVVVVGCIGLWGSCSSMIFCRRFFVWNDVG